MFIAPLDSEAKKLTKREHSEYKKRSLILGIIITCAGIIMIRIKTSLFYVCVASLVLESILLVLGKKQTLSEN
jgi:accessory gene regulator protein AgrB